MTVFDIPQVWTQFSRLEPRLQAALLWLAQVDGFKMMLTLSPEVLLAVHAELVAKGELKPQVPSERSEGGEAAAAVSERGEGE